MICDITFVYYNITHMDHPKLKQFYEKNLMSPSIKNIGDASLIEKIINIHVDQLFKNLNIVLTKWKITCSSDFSLSYDNTIDFSDLISDYLPYFTFSQSFKTMLYEFTEKLDRTMLLTDLVNAYFIDVDAEKLKNTS